MGIIDNLKDAAKLAKGLGNMDLYKQILDLQGEALEMQEQLNQKTKRITELEEALAVKENLVFVEPAYYEMDKDGKPIEVPYCQTCFEGEGRAIHLVYSTMAESDDGEHEVWVCHKCDKLFRLFRDKPTRKYIPPRPPTIIV